MQVELNSWINSGLMSLVLVSTVYARLQQRHRLSLNIVF